MAIRAELIQYAGNVVRVYNKPERTVSRIKWNDTVYVPEQTCKNDAFVGFKCSSCGHMVVAWSNLTTAPIPIKYCPGCGAKVVE